MRCPYCGHADTRVVDSRNTSDGYAIRRRRACSGCGQRFTTYEQLAECPIAVVKKDGTREPFDRDKIRGGLVRACYKRPVSEAAIDTAVGRIEATLVRSGQGEVPSRMVGELAMQELRELDDVAYIRFASVYREFQDVSDFQAEIGPMLATDAE